MDTFGSKSSKPLDQTSSLNLSPAGERVPRAAMLDAWAEGDWPEGVRIDRLAELETLAVRTAYSVYEITVLNGSKGEVLVRGGQYFPEWTPAILSGCTLGGTFLKRGGIVPGMRMEFAPEPVQMVSEVVVDPVTGKKEFKLGHVVITTSPVQSIGVVR